VKGFRSAAMMFLAKVKNPQKILKELVEKKSMRTNLADK